MIIFMMSKMGLIHEVMTENYTLRKIDIENQL